MVLEDSFMIQSEMQANTSSVTGEGTGNAADLDNEDCTTGLVRKVRRVLLDNMDNIVVLFDFASGVTGTYATALGLSVQLTNYQERVLSPEDLDEAQLQFLASATDNRFQGYLTVISGTVVNGVRVSIEYYDDISP